MADLIHRRVKFIIATKITDDEFGKAVGQVIEVTNLRTQFRIVKTSEKHPNSAEITVTNFAKSTRSALQQKGVRFIMQAGYDDTLDTLFTGDARSVDHERKGSDWETIVKAGDGERAMQFAHVNETFAGGTKISDVLKKVGKALKIDTGNLDLKVKDIGGEYVNGYTAVGPASRELDRILKSLGYEWSIQDNQLQILKDTEARSIVVPEITPDSGLIGSPEMGSPSKKGKPPLLKFRCLLNPQLKPGAQVKMRSERYPLAAYRIRTVEHTGDTAGGDWYSDVQCLKVKS